MQLASDEAFADIVPGMGQQHYNITNISVVGSHVVARYAVTTTDRDAIRKGRRYFDAATKSSESTQMVAIRAAFNTSVRSKGLQLPDDFEMQMTYVVSSS